MNLSFYAQIFFSLFLSIHIFIIYAHFVPINYKKQKKHRKKGRARQRGKNRTNYYKKHVNDKPKSKYAEWINGGPSRAESQNEPNIYIFMFVCVCVCTRMECTARRSKEIWMNKIWISLWIIRRGTEQKKRSKSSKKQNCISRILITIYYIYYVLIAWIKIKIWMMTMCLLMECGCIVLPTQQNKKHEYICDTLSQCHYIIWFIKIHLSTQTFRYMQ